MLTIKKDAPTEWMLVKVPRITNKETGADKTAQRLRESIRENHFGGEGATVRKLSEKECAAINFVNRKC